MRVDLHTHSRASDGSLTPQELILRAQVKQITHLALTDHDTTAGLADARVAAGDRLMLINGVEISTGWHSFDIHIVGLGFDIDNAPLQEALSVQREKREERGREMGSRLARKGIEGVYERARELAADAAVTRAHMARVLVERQLVSTFPKVFDKYLSRGNLGYVPNQWMTIEEAVALLQGAGGLAVLAHPTHYQLSNKWLRKLIDEFAAAGGDALEIGMPQVKREHRLWLADLAEKHQLLGSVGSDFHAPSPWRELGKDLDVPDHCRLIFERLGIVEPS
jgi:predicted metal-dependent phosphoesterase TrpH